MNETSSQLHGWTRRNFLKAAGAAGALMLFPWLAYAAESDELNAKADDLEASAAEKQAQADEVAAKLEALQTQFNEALERYNTANDAHEAAVAAMNEAQDRIDEATVRISELQVKLSDRAAAIYREGEPTFIDVLFGSESFEDFVTNWDSMEKIGEQDARLVQESKDAKAEAEAAREEYAKQEEIAAEELSKARAAKEELESAQASLQAEYDQMNEDIIAIHAEIEQVRMDAEAAREKEEAAKKAAEEAIAQQQQAASPSAPSGSGSTSSTPSTGVSGWVNPAPGKYITSGFGWRASIGDYHQGVDLSCKYEPVYCMADGTVTTSGWFGTGGQAVTVNHGGGIVSWYLHGSQLLVSVGQKVSAGQQIMVSGNTGFSTGAHLHFQINVNSPNGVTGTAVNPTAYFGW
ncbi:MAG: peptidoglycan DD-metalloendopeptidase family protein [Slackia sp.]|nr:peptidoglycan DD-metalloendopeptidase family protein [Slackia sp.]